MKSIKVKFVGFWDGWNPDNNFIINTLRTFCNPELSDDPDYLFASCSSVEYLNYDCVRIFYTGENICPDFNVFDYAIGFEDMEFGDRYLRYPLYLVDELYGEDYKLMQTKHINPDETLSEKTDFCSFVVSNGRDTADEVRTLFFKQLSQYKKVNSGGRYLNNIGQPEGVEDKLAFQTKHKFSIAFENSAHPGYITEKLVQAFAAHTVPIYFGAEDVSKTFNKDAFVYCGGAEEVDECIKVVQSIDSDDEKYKRMISIPALLEENHDEVMREKLTDFLKNIVLQDLKKSYRTNRLSYGCSYCEREQKKEELMKKFEYHSQSVLYKLIKRIIKIQ